MAVDNATGPRSMGDQPGTTPIVSTTCPHQTAVARAEAAALLNWAEEMLLGQMESCQAIKQVKGRSIPAYIATKCSFCFGKGFITRQAYHEAARLLGIRIPPQPKPLARRRR